MVPVYSSFHITNTLSVCEFCFPFFNILYLFFCHLGTGYHLVIVKDANCNINELSSVIQSHVQQAEVEYVSLTEVSYLLPETECAMFPSLFRHLKANKGSLRILSFGTTATTMEEVFLKYVSHASLAHDCNIYILKTLFIVFQIKRN